MNTAKVGLAMRKGLSGLIFRKILCFNQKSRAKSASGKLISIVSGELQLVARGLILLPVLITGPVILIFSLCVLSFTFKEGVLIGLVIGILILGIEVFSSYYIRKFRYLEGVFSGERLKVVTDIINGIRTIKAYAWEIPFFKLANKFRK